LGDGRVAILPNLDAGRIQNLEQANSYAANWERMIREERDVSNKLRQLGFEAQDITIENLNIGGGELPVIVTGRFREMAENGAQIRDVKNKRSSTGTSMLFGTPENLDSVDRLKLVMNGLLDDSVKLITHGLSFGGDSCNLIIKDTEQTPLHNRNEPGLFDERNQQLRFFLFDFSSKHSPRNDKGLKLLDASGNPSPEAIRGYAERYVTRAFEAVAESITINESDTILMLNKAQGNRHYDDIYGLFAHLEEKYDSIKDDLVEQVYSRAIAEIEQMPQPERLKRFSMPEKQPPTDLPGQGKPKVIPTESMDKGKARET